jgi:hypothetical protein
MTHKALIRRLQISCLGLDRIDPLCLLVDDVIAALAQTERTWVGLTDEEIFETHKQVDSMQYLTFANAIEAKLMEKNA